MARFERLAVLGLGLLGGSVALAAKSRGVAERVAGATRRTKVLEAALSRGIIDEAGSFEDAVEGADLVVLSTPVHVMGEIARLIAPRLREGAIVTDVGSVKATLADTLPGILPRGVHYVGAHPMAGSHHSGVEHARADLFEGAPCIVTPGIDAGVAERVAAFWRGLGARVVFRDPAVHDAEVAWMSHVPHVLSFAFSAALEGAPTDASEVAGPGFRDFTRIAHSDSELWSDILTANRKAIAAPLEAVAEAVTGLARAIEANDSEAVERWISTARSTLSSARPEETPDSKPAGGVPGAHAAKPNPESPEVSGESNRGRSRKHHS